MEYLAKYGKSYEDLKEYEMRKGIFEERLSIINEHNTRNNETWSMGLNEFSDMLAEEISKMMGGRLDIDNTEHLEASLNELLMASSVAPVDWRERLTPAKNQRKCGSCWAFSATAVIEARYAIKYGK